MKRRIVLALAPLMLAGCGYNQIQQYDEQAAQAKPGRAEPGGAACPTFCASASTTGSSLSRSTYS